MAQAAAPKCDICEEDIAKVFCYECHNFLCQSCNSWHEKFPATKRHTVTDSQCVDRSTLMLTLVCEDHKLEFAHYCRNCECLICTQCVTSVHKGHSFIDIAEVVATSRGDVKNRLEQIKDNIKTLSGSIEAFKTTKQTKLQTGTESFTKEVTKVSQDLVRIIETVTETNLTDAYDFLAHEKQQLLCNLSKLEKSHSEYYSIHEKFEQILRQKHDVSFFFKHNSLEKEFELLDDIPSPEEPRDIDPFKRECFVKSVIDQIQSKYNMSEVVNPDSFGTLSLRSMKTVAVAIQIDGWESECAFSFRHEPDKLHFPLPYCKSTLHGSQTCKLPNSILLNSNEEFVAFGDDAEDIYFKRVSEENLHDWFFVRRFTTSVNKYRDIAGDFKIVTEDGRKKISAMVLFRMLFEFHMDHALRNMKLNESVQSGLTKTDIQWVLVIPEIWNSNSMKRFLCTAFKKAGVDDLIVGSDPEVASLYCEYVAVEKETDDLKIFHSGNKYIVFDCGDYTTFVSVHRVQQEKTLHGVVKSIFRDVGDTGSKKAFTQLMDDIIGNRIFSDFRNNYPADSVDMLREFEMQMSIFCGDEDIKVKLRIPVSLIQTFEKETGKSLRDAMSKTPFSDRIKWVNNKLQIKTHLFACLLDTTMQHSICLLREMLRDPKVVGTTNIIMIGRCSKYPYLQRIIKQEFSSFNVVIPADARLSVLKGAVILGHYSR